jgi:hypothetical protein
MLARDPRLAALFIDGEEVEFALPRIVIAFPRSFDAERARERAKEAAELARAILGAPVELEVREGRGNAPSAHQAEAQRAREEREQRRQEALNHPARQLVKEAFGDEARFNEPEVE